MTGWILFGSILRSFVKREREERFTLSRRHKDHIILYSLVVAVGIALHWLGSLAVLAHQAKLTCVQGTTKSVDFTSSIAEIKVRIGIDKSKNPLMGLEC